MPNARRPPAVRTAERKGRRCAVGGCSRFVHGLSQWCSRHHSAALRYGSPTQRRVFQKELAPYHRMVSAVIRANKDHPAVVLVVEQLQELLTTAAASAAQHPYPSPQDWRGRMNVDLARLHNDGVNGLEVLRMCAAVYFFARSNTRDLAPLSRPYHFALARHVLNLTTRERYGGWCERKTFTGWVDRKGTKRLSTRALEALGRHLATTLAPLLSALEPAYDRHAIAPVMRRRRMAEALQQPFT